MFGIYSINSISQGSLNFDYWICLLGMFLSPTMVNHHFSPSFGLICLILGKHLKQIQIGQMDGKNKWPHRRSWRCFTTGIIKLHMFGVGSKLMEMYGNRLREIFFVMMHCLGLVSYNDPYVRPDFKDCFLKIDLNLGKCPASKLTATGCGNRPGFPKPRGNRIISQPWFFKGPCF